MEWLARLLHLPPLDEHTALHIDLASAFIALLALAFSIYAWRHQNRVRQRALIAQRDSGLTQWIELAIDTIVDLEFLLRNATETGDAAKFMIERDQRLAKLAATIDKGRLYFPTFTRDVVDDPNKPMPKAAAPERKPASPKARLRLLDDLVEIYDLANSADVRDVEALKRTRFDLMMKKRDLIKIAQRQIAFRRVPGIVEEGLSQ